MTTADQHPPRSASWRVELLARAARGDHQAFAELYDDVSSLAYGVARRILRDADLAADVTQEVMVEMWRTADRYQPDTGPVTAWVALLSRRRAVDRVRSEQAHRDRNAHAASGSIDRPFDDVAETVIGRDEANAVHRCLESLTELQREAVMRAFYGGLSYREVAEVSHSALPTIKSRIRDGLLRLRTCLGRDSVEGGA